MKIPPRSGAFHNRAAAEKYAVQVSDRLCGCVAVLPRLWPGVRYKLNEKTLPDAWIKKKNDQAYAQILSAIKLSGESDVVRPIVSDAKYPTIEYPQSTAVPAEVVIQDLTYASKVNGDTAISIEYVDPGEAGVIAIAVVAKAIEVTLAHDGSDPTSDGDAIKAAIEADGTANGLVDIVVSGDGATVQAAQAATFLDLAWEQDGVEFTTNPEETALIATRAFRLWVEDGSIGDDIAFKITDKDLVKKRFILHLATKESDGSWTEYYYKTVSAVSSGQYSLDDAGASIFVDSVLEMSGKIVRSLFAEDITMADIPVMTDWLSFTGGELGSAPTTEEWKAAVDVLKAGDTKEYYSAGVTETTVIDYLGAVALSKDANFSFDLTLTHSVVSAISEREGFAACQVAYPYFNPMKIDDPSGIGKMWIGHSGHAAGLSSKGFSEAALGPAEAIAGVPWGGIGLYSNVELYHDSLSDEDGGDLDLLAEAKINVCVPAPKNSGFSICFNDQWSMANVESDDQFRHVNATRNLVAEEAINYFNQKAHRSTKEIENSIELFEDAYLKPKETIQMLKANDKYPAYEISYGEHPDIAGVYKVSVAIVVIQSNRQIIITTQTRR